MSTILWKHALTPPPDEAPDEMAWAAYDGALRAARTVRLRLADEAIVDLPDPRAYRSLSRAGLLLAAAGLQAREALAPYLSVDPYRVGLYCANEWGPNDYNSARQMVDTSPEEFAATYKNLRSAKQYFKMLPNVPPSQLAIFLGVMGPLGVFIHSRLGCLHALDQAEYDLGAGVIDAALVCSAFSLEDPLLALRTRRDLGPEPLLCEGAGCVVLVPDGNHTDWRTLRAGCGQRAFGIASDIVALALGREYDECRSGSVSPRRERDQGRAAHPRPLACAGDVAHPGPGS